LYSQKFSLPAQDIKKLLQNMYHQKEWLILPTLDEETSLDQIEQINTFLFDAYSTKTDPQLWSPQFIRHLIQQTGAEKCVFTTYAANKNIKQALIGENFTLNSAKGFHYKKESTFATRS
jgi:tRNA U34 5-methylaminomethyl-2-thiouridine-forming methyltransferase MnmC